MKLTTELKNAWSYTSTPSYIFQVWCLIKQRINLHDVPLSYAHLCLHRAKFQWTNKSTVNKDSGLSDLLCISGPESAPILRRLNHHYMEKNTTTVFRTTWLPTLWGRVIWEAHSCSQLVNKSPAFYGTCRFIPVFTRVHQWSLPWVRWI
jgi:hypothetical protein